MNDNASPTLNGSVHTILPLETFPSGFSKQVLILKTVDGKYEQFIPIEFFKDKTELLSNLQEGQLVTAYINIRGNEYKGKYYANIQGWKIESEGSQEQQTQSRPEPAAGQPVDDEEDDQIPF